MGARELGELCEAERRRRGWSLARVAYEIGLVPPHDRALNESQAKRILEGRRGLDEWMIWRLISVFGLRPAAAWAAAGLLPKGVDEEMLSKLEFFATTPSELTARSVGQTVLPVPAELQDAALLRRLGVPNLERRRVQRRRRLRLVPQVERRVA